MANKEEGVEQTGRNIRKKTCNQYTSEEKICIVLKGLRGDSTVVGASLRPQVLAMILPSKHLVAALPI